MLFPDGGNENMSDTLKRFVWDSRYADSRLGELKVLPNFRSMLRLCRHSYIEAMVADSHKYMYSFVTQNTFPDEEFEVYNIDFHHDLYNYFSGAERVNCGNWATLLREDRPNMKYVWVKRNDSDMEALGLKSVKQLSNVKVTTSFANAVMSKVNADPSFFDYLFLCRSAMWSPPHLDKHFVKLVKAVLENSPTKHEDGIDEPRDYEVSGLSLSYHLLFNRD